MQVIRHKLAEMASHITQARAREFPVERFYRDARLWSIGGGTSEIMKEIIARRLL